MIISMINLKGGVGKTTSAIALATAAARDGRDVVVFDADPQASASLWADLAVETGDALPFPVEPANLSTMRRLRNKTEDRWVFIDCPPSGSVMDEATIASDIVIVPTGTGPADLQKAWETASTLEKTGKRYAVLVTRTLRNTLSFKAAVGMLEEDDMSYFDSTIPQREDLKKFFGNSFGSDLFGYAEVYNELKETMEVAVDVD